MDKLILGIESSCDETAAAVVRSGREVLSNIISSQIEIHKKYGGVVPEIASRKHIENICPVVDEALRTAGVGFSDIDAIAVTYGPGLVGALLVGVSAAKAMSFALHKPLVAVNHIHGHIAANYIAHPELEPPFVCLVASGGHSHIVRVRDYTDVDIVAGTRDDAAGEAFDKIARVLGLGYPGGPKVEALAREGDPHAVTFPRVDFGAGCLDFSFSGVKTAVINYLHKLEQRGETYNRADIAASFQCAVAETLADHAVRAAQDAGTGRVVLAGGVAANGALREAMARRAGECGMDVLFPPPVLCTDNAAMIASAGYYKFVRGDVAGPDLNAVAGLQLC